MDPSTPGSIGPWAPGSKDFRRFFNPEKSSLIEIPALAIALARGNSCSIRRSASDFRFRKFAGEFSRQNRFSFWVKKAGEFRKFSSEFRDPSLGCVPWVPGCVTLDPGSVPRGPWTSCRYFCSNRSDSAAVRGVSGVKSSVLRSASIEAWDGRRITWVENINLDSSVS